MLYFHLFLSEVQNEVSHLSYNQVLRNCHQKYRFQDLFDRDGNRLAVVQRILDRGGRHTDAGLDALQHIVAAYTLKLRHSF